MRNELGSIFGHDCYIKQGPTVPRKKILDYLFLLRRSPLRLTHGLYALTSRPK